MPDLPDTLAEQMRSMLPDESAAVSAEEAMSIASFRAINVARKTLSDGDRFRLPRMGTAGFRRPAWIWLSVVVLLVLALVIGSTLAFRSKSTPVVPAHPAPISVDVAATPKGWVPVEYKDIQLSVPGSWTFATADCPSRIPTGEVFLPGIARAVKSCPAPASSLTIWMAQDPISKHPSHLMDVNGITVALLAGAPDSNAPAVALLPDFKIEVRLVAQGLTSRILQTLTYSPRTVALSRGAHPSVPSSWRTVTSAGLSMSVPGNWAIKGQDTWGPPMGVPTDLTFADLATYTQPSMVDTNPSVILDSGVVDLYNECRGCWPSIRGSPGWDSTPIDGLLVDSGLVGPSLQDVPSRSSCLHINNVTACPTSNDVYGVLVLAIDFPGSTPVAVEIGLAGDGVVARSILYSIHASDATPTDTTPTTTPIKLNPWHFHTIASTGRAQDISPTSTNVYWLSQNGVLQNDGAPISLYRYDPISGQVTKRSLVTGFLGSPALTVTGGWVWTVVGIGDDVVVQQRDPSTLALHASESLHVENSPSSYGLNPVLTATVNGPLWVAGDEDLWALNPSSGAVETEFDTDNEIGSMSTDPTGALLYTSAQTTSDGGDGDVTEYDAQSGRELQRTDLQGAINGGSVAATNTGVWVSVRYGMTGAAFELSAHGLREIAPPPSKDGSFGTYDQMMGIGSGISEQTLWLTSNAQIATLKCADPTTGAVRASESTTPAVSGPIASGKNLYAVGALGQVLVITPPATCFG